MKDLTQLYPQGFTTPYDDGPEDFRDKMAEAEYNDLHMEYKEDDIAELFTKLVDR